MFLSGLNLSTLRSLVITISRSYRVSTENGWKSVLLENLNRFNRNRLRLKQLIPIEHGLRKPCGSVTCARGPFPCIRTAFRMQPRSHGPLSSSLKKVPRLQLVTCLLDFCPFDGRGTMVKFLAPLNSEGRGN